MRWRRGPGDPRAASGRRQSCRSARRRGSRLLPPSVKVGRLVHADARVDHVVAVDVVDVQHPGREVDVEGFLHPVGLALDHALVGFQPVPGALEVGELHRHPAPRTQRVVVGAQHRFVLGDRRAEAEARGEADEAVEAAQLRRQRLHQVGDVVGRAGVDALGLGDRDLRDVDPDRVDPVLGQGGDEAAEPAARVQHPVALGEAEQLDRQRRLLLVALVAPEPLGDAHVGGAVSVDLVENRGRIAHETQSVPRPPNAGTSCFVGLLDT